MKIPVLWYRSSNSSWCHALPKWLMQSASYEHFTKYAEVPHDGAIVVIKADEINIDELNYDVMRFGWLLLMVCSNEEGKWDTARIERPGLRQERTKVWLQTPAPHQKADRYFPWGWAADCADLSDEDGRPALRTLDWFFAGQDTHIRRHECIAAMENCGGKGVVVKTHGFSQGLPRDIYLELMTRTCVAPCPSGPFTVDSFRVWEALEMGAVPLVDMKSPVRADPLYWQSVLGPDMPLPTVECWEDLPDLMDAWLDGWESKSAKIFQWYGKKKMEWRRDLLADVEALRAAR